MLATSLKSGGKYKDLTRTDLVKLMKRILDEAKAEVYYNEERLHGRSTSREDHYDTVEAMSNEEIMELVCEDVEDELYPAHERLLEKSSDDTTKRAFQAITRNLNKLQVEYGKAIIF